MLDYLGTQMEQHSEMLCWILLALLKVRMVQILTVVQVQVMLEELLDIALTVQLRTM